MIKNLSQEKIITLGGVLLAFFAFNFGPWMGSRSALWILADLVDFLTSPNKPADVSRPRTILLLLASLLLLLMGMGAAIYKLIRATRRQWAIIGMILALAALVVLGVLFFGYDARTSGLSLTALGCTLAAGGALAVSLRSITAVEKLVQTPAKESRLAFQQEIAAKFHECQRKDTPFGLCVIGIAHFEGYVEVFGAKEGHKMTTALYDIIRQICPTGIATRFIGDKVMLALPEATGDQLDKIIAETATNMRSRGFVGEMVLPDGQVELVSGTASFPHDAGNLGKLIEKALAAYAKALSLLQEPQAAQEEQEAAQEIDPMLAFQEQSSASFHECKIAERPFSLCVIGMAYFESYVTVFGTELDRDLPDTLLNETREVCPTGIAVSFSVGAVMVALPETTVDLIDEIVQQLTARMRSYGFISEMVLPGGQLELISGASGYPQDGNNLGQLTEKALSAYADALTETRTN